MLLIATFMNVLDGFVVNVAGPTIQASLHASFPQIQLVIAGYVLAYAVALVTGGRLGDRHGRRRVFLLGTAAFTLFSVACSVAPNAESLIAFRVCQGLAAALMLPQVLSIIRVTFALKERTVALALYAAVLGLASIAGQTIGGLLIQADVAGLGWRAVFLLNLGVGLIALIAAGPTVRESRAHGEQRLDLVGASLLSVAMLLLLYPLVEAQSDRGPAWAPISLIASGIVLFAFVVFERWVAQRGGSPLVPPRLFAEPQVRLGLGVVLVFYAGNAGLFLVLAYYLQAGLGLSPLASGLLFTPLGFGFCLSSLGSRFLVSRMGALWLNLGAGLMAFGLLGLGAVVGRWAGSAQILWLAPPLFTAGLGQGLIVAPLAGLILAGVRSRDAGAVSGVLLTVIQLAWTLGITTIGALFDAALGGSPQMRVGAAGDFARAFTVCLVPLVALTLITLMLTIMLGRTSDRHDQLENEAERHHQAAAGQRQPG